jgi:hypothetical protein
MAQLVKFGTVWKYAAAIMGGIVLMATFGDKLTGCAGLVVVTQEQFTEHDRETREALEKIRTDLAILKARQP